MLLDLHITQAQDSGAPLGNVGQKEHTDEMIRVMQQIFYDRLLIAMKLYGPQ